MNETSPTPIVTAPSPHRSTFPVPTDAPVVHAARALLEQLRELGRETVVSTRFAIAAAVCASAGTGAFVLAAVVLLRR